MTYLLKDKVLLSLIILGLIIRLLLIPLPGFKFDIDAWFAWAIRLNQVGFSNFYSSEIWTNYTPGFLYILKLLGFIRLVLNIPDSLFYISLKLPSVIAEISLGLLIFKITSEKSVFWARVCAGFILLNPAFIFNSAVWGQIDGLLSLLMIISIYWLVQKRVLYSSIFLGLSFLVKPQTIGLFPIFFLYLIRFFSLKNIFKAIFPTIFIIFVLSFPFYTTNIFGLPALFSKMVGDYSYTSLFAYNFWGIVGFWIKDNTLGYNLSYHFWGYLLYGSYWLLLSSLYLKKRLSLYSLAAVSMVSFFFLPTRVHERYLYPGFIFLIILIGFSKSKALLILLCLLSLLHFLNLYYVYVYYNEFYLKLPKALYNPFLYNFLDGNGKILSLISTVIFLIITFMIVKISYAAKKNNI